jgi:anti-sigma B factor antagonist
MEQPIEVTEQMVAGIPVIAVTGEVDLATAPLLGERLDAKLAAGHSTLVADLRGVSFLDSTGLSVLVKVLKRCLEEGGQLGLVIDQEKITKLFSITGLDDTFAIWPSLEDALASLEDEETPRPDTEVSE